MTKTVWKPGTMLYPLPPVMVTCGTTEKPNVLTVAWTGIINSQPPKTYVSIRPERYSHGLICESGELTINLPTKELVRAVDFCGVRSGRDTDKFAKCSLTAVPASEVSSPIIDECPVALECTVFDRVSYGSHDMFLCDIVAVDADDKFILPSGKLDLSKAGLIAYSHGEYFALGQRLGKFGFSVQKKKKRR